jgi:translocation and assembly module TamB
MHLDRLGPLVELARGSLPRDLGVPWEALGFSLESKGSVHGLARPMEASIEHRTHAVVRGLAMRRNTADFSARTIDLRFASHGTVARHDFDAALDLDSPRFGSVGGKGHEAVSLKGSYDFGKPRLDVQLASSGDVGPDGELALTADYDAPAERLAWKVSGKLDRLGLIGLLMPSALAQQHQVAWDKLGLEAHGEGQFTSLVKRFAPGLPPRAVLATDPLETMRGALTLDLTAKGLDYRGPDGAALLLPAFGGHLAAKADEGKLHADISLDMPSVNAHASGHKVDGEKLATTLVVDSEGTTENGSIRVQYGLSAGVIHQDAAPIYPLGDLKLNVVARADAKGSVRVEQAHFENLAGGTRLDLKGGVDLRPLGVRPDLRKTERVLAQAFSAGSWIPGRRNLIVEGELSQKLDRLNDPGQLRGRGTVSVPFQIESGNLTYVRASAKLGFTDVDLELPKSGLSVAGLNGLVPLSQDLVISPEGAVTPLFGATTTAYSRLRFSDHQPFMTGNPYLTARSIKLAQPDNKQHPEPLSVGPLAGNLRIDRNLIALDQFEADLGGGRVTGQVLVDYEGQDTEVSFHGAISGVRTEGEHERLDANAAISLLPLRRILEGRIEVVHLGRSHLERLLDLYDPYQADVSANRGRQALKVGYPRQVRLRFHEGFGSLALEMGGLASAVRIDEINGIPMGPILERYLAPRKPEAEIQ